jgi:hypothetical protein
LKAKSLYYFHKKFKINPKNPQKTFFVGFLGGFFGFFWVGFSMPTLIRMRKDADTRLSVKLDPDPH